MIHEQNENIKRQNYKKESNRNSGTEEHNNSTEKFNKELQITDLTKQTKESVN